MVTKELQALLTLPIQLQIVLAAGFLGYLAAFSQMRDEHKQVEMFFYIILFSTIASAIMGVLPGNWPPVLLGLAALSATAFVGFAWNRWLRKWLISVLRWKRLTQNDGSGAPTAWRSIAFDSSLSWSQVFVTTTDGAVFECDDTKAIKKSSIGIVKTDKNGNIAMIATSRVDANGERRDFTNRVLNDDFGDLVTYIPADRITSIDIRLKKN